MKANIECPIFETEAMKILDCDRLNLMTLCRDRVIRSYQMKNTDKLYFFKSELMKDIERSHKLYKKVKARIDQISRDLQQLKNDNKE